MDSAVKLIEALSKLFGSLAWPLTVAVVVLVVLGRHRGAVDKALDRVEKIVAPGGVEIALGQVLKDHEQQVIEKAVQVADSPPEKREAAVEELAKETRVHRELRSLLRIVHDKSQPKAARQQAMDLVLEQSAQINVRRPDGGFVSVRTIDALDKNQTD